MLQFLKKMDPDRYNLLQSLKVDLLLFRYRGLNNDKRSWIVSVYLVLLVLFTTSFKSFFPNLTSNPIDDKLLSTLAHTVAVLYGFDIVGIVLYFIYIQIDWVKSTRRTTIWFDRLLLLNLLLINFAFLMLLIFASSSTGKPQWLTPIVGGAIGFSEIVGVFFAFYPIFLLIDNLWLDVAIAIIIWSLFGYLVLLLHID